MSGHFAASEDDSDEGTNEARSAACEVVALRYVNHLSERDVIDTLFYELPPPPSSETVGHEDDHVVESVEPVRTEQTPLLGSWRSVPRPETATDMNDSRSPADVSEESDVILAESLQGLNALEVAAVSGAKRFLGQKRIQQTITQIW